MPSHACERPLGGPRFASQMPQTPSINVHHAPAAACDRGSNRTYPKEASEAWLAVVMVMTSLQQLERFVAFGNYATWTENLLSERVVPVIFWPTADRWFAGHDGQWQAKALHARKCSAPHGEVPGTRCSKWHNPEGQIIVTCPVDMAVPLMYYGNLQHVRPFHARAPIVCARA